MTVNHAQCQMLSNGFDTYGCFTGSLWHRPSERHVSKPDEKICVRNACRSVYSHSKHKISTHQAACRYHYGTTTVAPATCKQLLFFVLREYLAIRSLVKWYACTLDLFSKWQNLAVDQCILGVQVSSTMYVSTVVKSTLHLRHCAGGFVSKEIQLRLSLQS